MKTNKPVVLQNGWRIIRPTAIKNNTAAKQGSKAASDIILNVNLKDSLIRLAITLLLPMLVFFIDKHWMVYTAPVIAHLLTTALTRFCVINMYGAVMFSTNLPLHYRPVVRIRTIRNNCGSF